MISIISDHFTQGNTFYDFLFAFLEKCSTFNIGSTPMGANSIIYQMTPIYMGGNNENDRVAPPESVPIHLNLRISTVLRTYTKSIRY